MDHRASNVQMQDVTNQEDLTKARKQREQFDRNSAWLQQNISNIYAKHRGKCICVAGEELFVGKSAKVVIAQATAAHPDDAGWFTRYIPMEKVARIYAV